MLGEFGGSLTGQPVNREEDDRPVLADIAQGTALLLDDPLESDPDRDTGDDEEPNHFPARSALRSSLRIIAELSQL